MEHLWSVLQHWYPLPLNYFWVKFPEDSRQRKFLLVLSNKELVILGGVLTWHL